ncbi:MAG: class I SAM-dependent methyltransferase [Anaerolineales bacterium]|nr:class I SAM-dependent methyltransferase [Anaerolineales bacterium]
MGIIQRFMQFFFKLIYHPFAWSYDFVAWTVSLGRWKDWVTSVLPFIQGTRVLELGHGPGHLQRLLLDLNLLAVGLDESRQMGSRAKDRLDHAGYTQIKLTRGLAQSLPFPAGIFDTVVASFPSEYIFDMQTLAEAYRVLNNGGRFLVLPAAWITGQKLMERFAAGLFRVTGQASSDPVEIISERLKRPFVEVGFCVKIEQVEVKSSLVLIVIAEKK